MTAEKKDIRRFFAGLVLPLFLLLLLCGASALLLAKSGEYLDIEDIITQQEKTSGLYGSALHQRIFYYKRRLYSRFKPEVTALGSSRVLQFRSADFSVPFVNIGSMGSLEKVIEMAKSAFAEHKPKLAIVGIDIWWFLPSAENNAESQAPEDVSPTLNDILSPVRWFLRGKLSLSGIATIMTEETPHIGIAAISRQDGYSIDGSYHYTSTLTGKVPADDSAFSATLKKIKGGEKIYAHSDKVSQEQLEKFRSLLAFFKQESIPVVVFVPPFAPAAVKAMTENGGYGYIAETRAALRDMATEKDIPFFDFHDASTLRATDCEFIDGCHGGPLVYQRILLEMALANKELRAVVKLTEAAWNIKTYGGQSSMHDDETDFLRMGCNKKK